MISFEVGHFLVAGPLMFCFPFPQVSIPCTWEKHGWKPPGIRSCEWALWGWSYEISSFGPGNQPRGGESRSATLMPTHLGSGPPRVPQT